MGDFEDIPDTGGIFIFGGKKVNASQTSWFWLKSDVILSASCGDGHTILRSQKGKVYVFGQNNWGQLGLGHTQNVEKPTCIKSLTSKVVTLVACGGDHTMIYTEDNELYGFGNNNDLQLALPSPSNCETPTKVNLPAIGKIKQIDAGADFSILLVESGEVYAFGGNGEGQLGLGSDINECFEPTILDLNEKIDSIACGYHHSAMISESGKLYMFGENEFGKLGVQSSSGSLLPTAVTLPASVIPSSVACGGSHTAFISTDKQLYTFGGGYRGELGHGENHLQADEPKMVEYLKDQYITQVYCGENFSCAISENGVLYTFGDGKGGKLGLEGEDFSNQFVPSITKLHHLSVAFVACGGCHMIVSARKKVTEENASNLISSRGDASIMEQQELLDISDNPDRKNITIGGSIAREKRRKARGKTLSQTLPALNTLNSEELRKAAETFSGSSVVFKKSAPHSSKTKESDEMSDVSAFNKVHCLAKTNGETTFVPVTVSKKPDSPVESYEETIGDDDDLSMEEESIEESEVKPEPETTLQDRSQNTTMTDHPKKEDTTTSPVPTQSEISDEAEEIVESDDNPSIPENPSKVTSPATTKQEQSAQGNGSSVDPDSPTQNKTDTPVDGEQTEQDKKTIDASDETPPAQTKTNKKSKFCAIL